MYVGDKLHTVVQQTCVIIRFYFQFTCDYNGMHYLLNKKMTEVVTPVFVFTKKSVFNFALELHCSAQFGVCFWWLYLLFFQCIDFSLEKCMIAIEKNCVKKIPLQDLFVLNSTQHVGVCLSKSTSHAMFCNSSGKIFCLSSSNCG